MLYLAWFLQDLKYEAYAYEGLALQNFYLGELQKAKHYNDRFISGKTENLMHS